MDRNRNPERWENDRCHENATAERGKLFGKRQMMFLFCSALILTERTKQQIPSGFQLHQPCCSS